MAKEKSEEKESSEEEIMKKLREIAGDKEEMEEIEDEPLETDANTNWPDEGFTDFSNSERASGIIESGETQQQFTNLEQHAEASPSSVSSNGEEQKSFYDPSTDYAAPQYSGAMYDEANTRARAVASEMDISGGALMRQAPSLLPSNTRQGVDARGFREEMEQGRIGTIHAGEREYVGTLRRAEGRKKLPFEQ